MNITNKIVDALFVFSITITVLSVLFIVIRESVFSGRPVVEVHTQVAPENSPPTHPPPEQKILTDDESREDRYLTQMCSRCGKHDRKFKMVEYSYIDRAKIYLCPSCVYDQAEAFIRLCPKEE